MSVPTMRPWNSQSMPWTVSANTPLNRVEYFNAAGVPFDTRQRTAYTKRRSDLQYEL